MAGNTWKFKRKGPTRCQRVKKKKQMKMTMMMMGDGKIERAMEMRRRMVMKTMR